MQKLIAVILVLIFSSKSYSQNNCGISDKTDEFTGKRTITTDAIKLIYKMNLLSMDHDNQWHLDIGFVYQNSSYYVYLIHASVRSAATFGSFYIKFSNDSILKLTSSNYKQTGNDTWKYATTYFKINDSELEKLKTRDIQKIRVNPGKNDESGMDIEVEKDKRRKIKSYAACIAEYKKN